MWQTIRNFRITWKWGVLSGVVLIVLGKFLEELSSNPANVESGGAMIGIGQLTLFIGVVAGIVAGVKTLSRCKTSELPR